ncbi:Hypothetical_protein [Hexamita inflata]|uniref:Hypothetical_protein n=1 Tax=Hexamita inflata TaxID=28002 RepID=A0AA86UFT0_9EUKA|nr:Hypothetical protein HINF_LOCUS26583 [Hexamita inflata]
MSDDLIRLKVNALLQKEYEKIIQSRHNQQNENVLNNFETEFKQLNENDKKFILEYRKIHPKLTPAQCIVHIMKSGFRGRENLKEDVLQFITHINENPIILSNQQQQKEQNQNQTDEQYVTKYIERHQNIPIAQAIQNLLHTYFKGRFVISEQTLDFLQSKLQQSGNPLTQSDEADRQDQNFASFTQIYTDTLQKLKKWDQNPKELCNIISKLTKNMKPKFWSLVEQHEKYNSTDIQSTPLEYFDNTYKLANKSQIKPKEQSEQTCVRTLKLQQIVSQTNYNQHTELYKSGLQYIYSQSYVDKTPKELRDEINKLNIEHQKLFWGYIQANSQPKRPISFLKFYFSNTYCAPTYSDKINDQDKGYIINYVVKNNTLRVIQLTEELMNNYFKSRDILQRAVYNYVEKIKKRKEVQNLILTQNNIKRYNQIQDTSISNSNSEQSQYVDNDMNEQSTNVKSTTSLRYNQIQDNGNSEQSQNTTVDLSGLKKNQDKLTFAKSTQVYKNSLEIILQKDCSQKTPKELCECINKLEADLLKQFWSYVVSNFTPQKTLQHLRTYYKRSYECVLYSDKLNDEDRTVIHQYIDKSNTQTTTQQVNYLLKNHFKKRDIFPQAIQQFIINQKAYSKNIKVKQLKIQNIPNPQDDIHIINPQNYSYLKQKHSLKDFYSAYYKQSLSNVLAQDCSEMQDPEIFKTVQNLNEDQSEQFWNHLQSIVIPEKTVKDLKYYFSLRYQVVMYSECLNQNDRTYIKNLIREQSQMTRKELLEYIMEKQFKNRNIYGEQVKQYLDNQYCIYYRQQLNNDTNMSSQDMLGNDTTIKAQLQDLSKQDFNTKLYQLGLEKISGQNYCKSTPIQIVQEINKLNPIQQKIFWGFVQSYDQQKTQSVQKYFRRTYSKIIYSDNINDVDRQYILKYIADNKELPLKKQLEWLVENYFVFRDVFPQQIYRYIQEQNKKLFKK